MINLNFIFEKKKGKKGKSQTKRRNRKQRTLEKKERNTEKAKEIDDLYIAIYYSQDRSCLPINFSKDKFEERFENFKIICLQQMVKDIFCIVEREDLHPKISLHLNLKKI